MSSDAYSVLISVFVVILVPMLIGVIREIMPKRNRTGTDKTRKARQP